MYVHDFNGGIMHSLIMHIRNEENALSNAETVSGRGRERLA